MKILIDKDIPDPTGMEFFKEIKGKTYYVRIEVQNQSLRLLQIMKVDLPNGK